MIIDHTSETYQRTRRKAGAGKYNGAYYYSKEIVENIIPHIKTDRNWVTINTGEGCNHAIVFIHNNDHPEYYDWLKQYRDLVLVCGVPTTCEKVAHLGMPVYLPLSIDVEDVKAHKRRKTKDVAFAGRANKKTFALPKDVDLLEDMPRSMLLSRMAEYRYIYAVGRTALEAKALGCKILPYDSRYPDVTLWKVLDNSDAVQILQAKLDEIDG